MELPRFNQDNLTALQKQIDDIYDQLNLIALGINRLLNNRLVRVEPNLN